MDFALTPSQQAARDQAIEFARRELTTGDVNPDFDFDGWKKCRQICATGVTVPTDYGGRGQTLDEFVAMMEGLGYASRRMGLCTAIAAHVFGVVEPLHVAGTEEQKKKWLRKLATGDWVGAHSVTEPQAGSDLMSFLTTAVLHGDHYVINGKKRYT